MCSFINFPCWKVQWEKEATYYFLNYLFIHCLLMISILLILLILGQSIPSYKSTVSSIAWSRLSSVVIIFSSFLIMNTFYFNRIGSGLFLFSGFFKLTLINQSIEIILLILGGLILIPIINNLPYAHLNLPLYGKKGNLNYLTNSSSPSFSAQSNKGMSSWLDNYFLIILFNLLGACCLITSGDLLTLYVAIELQSFSLYILSTLNKDSINSASAGLKYFLVGSLASTFILLGIALIYYSTGLTNFESLFIYFNITDYFSSSVLPFDNLDIFGNPVYPVWNFADFSPFSSSSKILILSFVLIIIGSFIKIAAAPFHQWSPDVYDQVPTKVTVWLVIIPKLSIFIFLFGLLDLILGTGNAADLYSVSDIIFDQVTELSRSLPWLSVPVNIDFNLTTRWLMDGFINNLLEIYDDAVFFSVIGENLGMINGYNTELGFDFNEYNINVENYYAFLHNFGYFIFYTQQINDSLIKNFLILIAVISLIIGSISGLHQIKIKRLLAFSAISHVGFLIISLSINTKLGLESFIFYLTQYSLTNLNIFLILLAFGYLTYIFANNNNNSAPLNSPSFPPQIGGEQHLSQDINFISQLTGLFKYNSILTISFAISLFSMAGVPPLLGFYGKQQVLLTAISVGFIFVSIIAINMSVISAYYYLKLIQVSSFISPNLTSIIQNIISSSSPNVSSLKESLITETSTPQKIELNYFNNNNSTLINSLNLNNDLQLQSSITQYQTIIQNSHSYLISIITLIILLFTFKPNILFNFTNILSSNLIF